jgi:hypothetical protein
MCEDEGKVEEFFEFKTKEATERAKKEFGMWQQWQQGGKKPEDLEPLLKVYEPRFQQKIYQWKPPAAVEAAIKADLHKNFIEALHKYDPNKASLSTYVDKRLQKTQRTINKVRGVGYMPEAQVGQIGKLQSAHNELAEQFGRDPTHAEIASHTKMQPIHVKRIMEGAARKDVPTSMLQSDPSTQPALREREVLNLLPDELSSDELQVFNHVYGRRGFARVASTSQLAKRLGKSPSQVSRLKSRIAKKYKRYL